MNLFGRKKIKELEAKLKIAQADNIILLENAEELREQLRVAEKTIKSLEEDIKSLRDEAIKGAVKKRPGRKKKESTENS